MTFEYNNTYQVIENLSPQKYGIGQEVASSIPALYHTFKEINVEIISTVIRLPFADSRRVVVSYKRKYVHEVLVHCSSLPRKRVWLGELTLLT